jgi:hypothetical protein
MDINDARLQVEVTPLKRDPFGRAKPGGSREDHHRPVAGREILRHGIELNPRLERALLPATQRRVVHPKLRQVDVDHSPDDRAREHLRSACVASKR